MNTSNTEIRNFLPELYDRTGRLPINHNYLGEQFADVDEILAKLREVVLRGDFTLGSAVDQFETQWAGLTGTKHAVGVGSGTDALFLALKALGVGEGDEVITTPYTFFATVGAIVTAGARPVFVDIQDDYNIDPDKIEKAISPHTKAILPVHWSGKPCRMTEIQAVAQAHGLRVVEDACHAISATLDGRPAGSFGDVGCFSMHPLKNVNVWGDGGVAVTNSDDIARRLRLLRNHGLVDRDHCELFAYNSRLDTIQAVVATHLLQKLDYITERRIANASYFDRVLSGVRGITVPARENNIKQVFHIYVVRAERRDELVSHLVRNGVDAKIHYPVPMHLQPAARAYGYKTGSFPVAESICNSVFSLPVHEFITQDQQDAVIKLIKSFLA